nr:MAG TPA: hypothetical protein [Caudoviricetes sp.]
MKKCKKAIDKSTLLVYNYKCSKEVKQKTK